MCPQNEVDGYLADDVESRMRVLAPSQCRLCSHLVTRRSFFTGQAEVLCCKPDGEDINAEILGALLMNLAKNDRCGFCSPLKKLL